MNSWEKVGLTKLCLLQNIGYNNQGPEGRLVPRIIVEGVEPYQLLEYFAIHVFSRAFSILHIYLGQPGKDLDRAWRDGPLFFQQLYPLKRRTYD